MARHSSIVSSPVLHDFFECFLGVYPSSNRVSGHVGHDGYVTRKSIGNVGVDNSPIEREQPVWLAVQKKAPPGLLDGRRPI